MDIWFIENSGQETRKCRWASRVRRPF